MVEKEPENQYHRMKKALVGLLIVLVTIAIFIATSQLDGLFSVIQTIFGIVGLPMIMSLLLYYIANPIVNSFEQRGMERKPAVALFFVLAIFVIVFFAAIISPMVSEQAVQLFNNFPQYFQEISEFLEGFIVSDQFDQILAYVSDFNIVETIQNQTQNLVSAAVGGINNVIEAVTQIVLIIFTTPFILYYMLIANNNSADNLLTIFPTKYRQTIKSMFTEINTQLSSYIRGQILVAIGVGIMLGVGFSIIGLDYALILGIIAGVLNVIPYFGSFVGFLLALIVAAVHSPFMIVKTIIVFAIEQFVEGRILSPLVLGANLKIHPITVLFVLLLGARFMGVLGAFVSIPIYAIVKIVFSYALDWYKNSRSDLFEEVKK